jgi:hypothetical protein
MSASTHPQHIENLIANLREVESLQEIPSQITPPGPGRKHAVQVLHKSAIVLLVACWEAFAENLASRALEEMIQNAPDHSVFPEDVLDRVASKHQGMKAWDLAGTGWKNALKSQLKDVLARTTGTLNTPRTVQIDDLFEKTLGLRTLSSRWFWPGRSALQSQSALDSLVTLRGAIAHRVAVRKTVRKKDVADQRP